MPSPADEDYYALLGVRVTADGAELRRAWRQLALQYHPDRAGATATAMFQRLSAAYDVLSDPIARARYDGRRRRRPRADRSAVAASATDPSTSTAYRPAPAVMLSRLCGHLTTLLATGAASHDDDDADLITLVLSSAEATQGGMVTIAMWVDVTCANCARMPSAPCSRCGGTRTTKELYSAWLAIPPEVKAGERLTPSADLPGMLRPVRFCVEYAAVRL
jgi:DnaJ-class molecular chaperone